MDHRNHLLVFLLAVAVVFVLLLLERGRKNEREREGEREGENLLSPLVFLLFLIVSFSGAIDVVIIIVLRDYYCSYDYFCCYYYSSY